MKMARRDLNDVKVNVIKTCCLGEWGCYDPEAHWLAISGQFHVSFPIAGHSLTREQIIDRVVSLLRERLPAEGFSDWSEHERKPIWEDAVLRRMASGAPRYEDERGVRPESA